MLSLKPVMSSDEAGRRVSFLSGASLARARVVTAITNLRGPLDSRIQRIIAAPFIPPNPYRHKPNGGGRVIVIVQSPSPPRSFVYHPDELAGSACFHAFFLSQSMW
jgi:hypothetical protein